MGVQGRFVVVGRVLEQISDKRSICERLSTSDPAVEVLLSNRWCPPAVSIGEPVSSRWANWKGDERIRSASIDLQDR